MALGQVDQSGKTTFIVTIIFVTLATIATGLRLLTRNAIKASIQADDWLIIAAVVMLFVTSGVEIWGIIVARGGQDLSSPIADYSEVKEYLKAIFIQGSFYYSCLTFVRLSITSFYRRIFSVPRFRRISFFVDGFSIIYFILGFLLNIFACTPVSHFWNQEAKGSCLKHFLIFLIINETFGIVLDTCILALPVRMIIKLQMATRTKVLLCGTFLLGGLVIITNIVRLILITSDGGGYANFTNVNLWSTIHSTTAILCASLPIYRPLLPKVADFYRDLRARYPSLLYTRSSFRKTSSTGVSDAKTAKTPYTEISDDTSQRTYHTTVEGSAGPRQDFDETGYPLNSIGVKKTVDIV